MGNMLTGITRMGNGYLGTFSSLRGLFWTILPVNHQHAYRYYRNVYLSSLCLPYWTVLPVDAQQAYRYYRNLYLSTLSVLY
jgi:hypothetical protein